MRLRKKQARYIPGLKYYAINNHKTRGYKGKNRYNFKNNYSNKKSKLSIMLISIGVILMIIGIMRVFQNTIVYSPMRFFGTTKGGVSFATSTILLFIGIVLMVLKKINLLGPILIFLGIITIVISIFFSLRMSLLPISLFKSILIFGAIFLGSALIIRGILELIRK